jgi:D-alanyl-D-alanine carboxypeptidase
MAYHYKKKRYKLKPIPILIAFIIVILLIGFVIFMIQNIIKDNSEQRSNLSSASENSSTINISSENTSAISSENASTISSEADRKQSSTPNETGSQTSSKTASSDSATLKPAIAKDSWNLILLNRSHSISKDMQFEKTKFDTQWIDSRVAPAYQAMCEAAKKDGITLYLRSGYRSIATQNVNYQADIERNMKKGYTKEQAVIETEKYYARPGQSEHHTGLALDIITPEYHTNVYTLSEKFAETKAYEWLVKHCADYGFILRYPKEKENITKINYEPWHYRYVGVEHAKYIMENNLTLEEYLGEN